MGQNLAYSEFSRNPDYRYNRLPLNRVPAYTAIMKLRLKELRKEAGLTQLELAERSGMSASYYNEIEKGRKTANGHRLEALAKALGVEPQDLISSNDDPRIVKLKLLAPHLSDERFSELLDYAQYLIEKDQT